MLNLSNFLSFLRAPLAFLFLLPDPSLRLFAITLAMITDSIDGYIARKNQVAGRFGAILDPAMDKFFVYFALIVMMAENKLLGWQAFAMISRDLALIIFGLYLGFSGYWQSYEFKAIRWGKVSTALQFMLLMGLSAGYVFPWYIYGAFIAIGLLALNELARA